MYCLYLFIFKLVDRKKKEKKEKIEPKWRKKRYENANDSLMYVKSFSSCSRNDLGQNDEIEMKRKKYEIREQKNRNLEELIFFYK